jgi:hypothetical protein
VLFWLVLLNPAVFNELIILLNTRVGLDTCPEKCITILYWVLDEFVMFTLVTLTGA